MLTSCHLKNPDPNAAEKDIHCCFSFTIRRDSYDMLVSAIDDKEGFANARAYRPALIIGNFMPINPKKHTSSS
jgi:hypothetical protein